MKSIISLILALITVLWVFTGTLQVSADEEYGLPFTDLNKSAWYYGNVKYVVENGIMNGVSSTVFEPTSNMSRAMSVTILYRLAGEPALTDTAHPFTDVAEGKWYTKAVIWAYVNGITTGKTENTFAPGDDISRGEFAVLLLRYTEHAELALPEVRKGNVADVPTIPFYARTAVRVMYRAKVINGRSGYKFEAHAKIMRAEAAAIIERMQSVAVPKDSIEEPDVPEYTPELYTDIVFIGNSFTYTGNLPAHFDTIAEDKLVRVTSFASALFSLDRHYTYFSNASHKDELDDIKNNADIIVLQEFGGYFPDRGATEKLKDLFGRDKKYYSILPFIGPTVTEVNTGINLPSGGSGNAGFAESKQLYLDELDVYVVYLSNVVDFDPSLGLDLMDFVVSPKDYHPNDLMGYCMGLIMYCTIFDEEAADQNDGDLSMHMIPGKSEAEKEAYMKRLKDTVQRILDIQN